MKPEAAVSGEHVGGSFSMESALEAAAPGATIHIPAGEYHAIPGGWLITKGVTLAGEMAGDGEHAVTMVTGDSPAFVIAPGTVDVTIANITFVTCVPLPELPDQIE